MSAARILFFMGFELTDYQLQNNSFMVDLQVLLGFSAKFNILIINILHPKNIALKSGNLSCFLADLQSELNDPLSCVIVQLGCWSLRENTQISKTKKRLPNPAIAYCLVFYRFLIVPRYNDKWRPWTAGITVAIPNIRLSRQNFIDKCDIYLRFISEIH